MGGLCSNFTLIRLLYLQIYEIVGLVRMVA
jgi:hypothetical protein